MRWIASVLVVAATVATAASAAPTPLPDPCLLLSSTQVAAAVGGSVVTRNLSGGRLEPTCTWTGPALGLMQTRMRFMLSVVHVPEETFIRGFRRSIPVFGLGGAAFSNQLGLFVWDRGLSLDFESSYLSVFPARAIALARVALARL